MADTDLINLYSKRILRLATDIPHTGHLENPMGSARCRAPLCGSVVKVDLDLTDGRVLHFAQDVKACALGQAAAAVIGAQIIGLNRHEISTLRAQLSGMLKADGPVPPPPFEDLEVLVPARAFTNRHASILLSLDATLAAFDAAANSACA